MISKANQVRPPHNYAFLQNAVLAAPNNYAFLRDPYFPNISYDSYPRESTSQQNSSYCYNTCLSCLCYHVSFECCWHWISKLTEILKQVISSANNHQFEISIY